MKTQLDYRIRLLNPASILAICLSLSALLLLPPRASATDFSFSTGSPDMRIGTLSSPASSELTETETADDFVLSQCVVLTQATFTGLIPSAAPVTNITDVEVEFYHVFPTDSDVIRMITVPTRVNSPADNEIASATRNSSDGSLSFSATVVSSSFTVANSVVTGIHPIPNQTTGGEGSVMGEEVTITVTFNQPILLPAGHYFIVPEVGLSSGNFLWLSAPGPPLFTDDLQSWIRNANIAPDWLRIGTDIVGGATPPTFNASFSLSGVTDGMSIIDQLVPCSGPVTGGTWKNHGQYVSSVAHAAQNLASLGCINQQEIGKIVSAAARSSCGKPNKHQMQQNQHKHHM
jgi:hypothetical protein